MKYTIKDVLKSFDMMDWAMLSIIATLLALAAWWAYLYENTGIMSGVGLGVPVGALVMVVGISVRDRMKASQRIG